MIEPIYVKELNKVYVPIPKVAHSTLKRALKVRWGRWQTWDGSNDPEIIVMWRDPHKRFESAWNFLARSTPERHAPWHNHTFNEFVERHIDSDDIHLRPQNKWEPNGRIKRIPWDFEAFAGEFDLPLPMQRKNSHPREKVVWPHDALAKFSERYEGDLHIWGTI